MTSELPFNPMILRFTFETNLRKGFKDLTCTKVVRVNLKERAHNSPPKPTRQMTAVKSRENSIGLRKNRKIKRQTQTNFIIKLSFQARNILLYMLATYIPNLKNVLVRKDGSLKLPKEKEKFLPNLPECSIYN